MRKCEFIEAFCYRLLVSLDLYVIFADLMSLITVGGSLPDTDIAQTPGLKFCILCHFATQLSSIWHAATIPSKFDDVQSYLNLNIAITLTIRLFSHIFNDYREESVEAVIIESYSHIISIVTHVKKAITIIASICFKLFHCFYQGI